MAVRNQEKAERARQEVLASHPGASLELVPLDLASQQSVKEAATVIRSAHPTLDILVNNAGVMAMPEGRTADGFETQFGINHLGHWTFTASLMPAIIDAGAARVVTVTSMARLNGRPVNPDDVNLEEGYGTWAAYGRAKLANYHFGLGLQHEFDRRGLPAESLIAHPGLSNTDLQANTVAHGGGGASAPAWEWLANKTGMSAARGALPQLRAATDPAAKGGECYGPRFGTNGPPVRRPVLRRNRDRDIATLWKVSSEMTGVQLFDESTTRA
jgi:NAD(P)-dependent dehydrogenase (short-subunit alcohol dehydrogenase family)